MEELVNIVSTIGFPIAFCGLMWFQSTKREEKQQEINEKREERLYLQMDKNIDVLNKFDNTLISIDKRLELLEKMGDKNE